MPSFVFFSSGYIATIHMVMAPQRKQKKYFLEKRRKLITEDKRDTIEYRETNKTARKMAKQDKHQTKQVQSLLEQNEGLNIF